jgi:hypothetical protein
MSIHTTAYLPGKYYSFVELAITSELLGDFQLSNLDNRT